jgi:regulatory protein
VAPRSSSRYSTAAPPSGSALDAGLRLLARRAHSRVELLLKLTRRGYEGAAIRAALRRLQELGYLDDQAFARSFVRRRGSVRGPRALSAELAARGVDRAEVDTAVAEFGEAEQVASATRIAERLYARKPSLGQWEILDEIGTKLVRRGFSVAVARAACRTVQAGLSDPEPA